MAYAKRSPEAIFGDHYEHATAQRYISHGWFVLHTSEVGRGATMVEGPTGKVIMPDLQIFDLVNQRQSRLVEVKAKRGAYPYHKLQIDCTGVDWPKWEAYCRLNDSGVPVDLAIIHLHWPLRFSPEIAPKLLCQSIDVLKQCGPMRLDNCAQFPRGGAVWDVRDFELLGDLPDPPQHILDLLRAIKCNFRVWEKPPLRWPSQRPRSGIILDPRQRFLWPREVT